MAEGGDRKYRNPSKIEQLAVCAPRGFALRTVPIGTGAYGSEMESFSRRQERSVRDRIWRDKIRNPITNRIAKPESSGRLGNFTNDGRGRYLLSLVTE